MRSDSRLQPAAQPCYPVRTMATKRQTFTRHYVGVGVSIPMDMRKAAMRRMRQLGPEINNFSRYVVWLIAADLRGASTPPAETETNTTQQAP